MEEVAKSCPDGQHMSPKAKMHFFRSCQITEKWKGLRRQPVSVLGSFQQLLHKDDDQLILENSL
jgi:hypothetical protein